MNQWLYNSDDELKVGGLCIHTVKLVCMFMFIYCCPPLIIVVIAQQMSGAAMYELVRLSTVTHKHMRAHTHTHTHTHMQVYPLAHCSYTCSHEIFFSWSQVRVGHGELVGEIIRLEEDMATIQVYEETCILIILT